MRRCRGRLYLLNKIVWGMMNPCCLGFVGLACGWVLVCRGEATAKASSFRKAGRWIIGGAILWMWFWSSGVPFRRWQKGVAREFPPRVAAEYPMADAIVDLGGGMGCRILSCWTCCQVPADSCGTTFSCMKSSDIGGIGSSGRIWQRS